MSDDTKKNRLVVKYESEKKLIPHYNSHVQYSSSINPSIYQKVIDLFDLRLSGQRILDLGCGTGKWAIYLAQEHKCRVTGLDYSVKRIQEANRTCEGLDCIFKVQDINIFVEETKDRFDIISMFEVLEHLEQPEELLNNSLKILNQGGCIIGSVPLRSRYRAHLQVFQNKNNLEKRLNVNVIDVWDKFAFWIKTNTLS